MNEPLTEPYSLFLFGLNSPVTRNRYSTRLRWFFSNIGMPEEPMEERCRLFVDKAKQEPSWATNQVLKFLQAYRERYDRREVAGSTIRNYVKVVKLLCEQNDVNIPWKKITRGLPRGKQSADDRAPSIEEIRKLCEYPDRRIKAIVYTMCSSAIRLSSWDFLRWGHIKPIERDRKVIAARVLVYAGEEEQYFTFLTPEAYKELETWMEFRKLHGEQITKDSWLMRDLWNTLDSRISGFVSAPKKKQVGGIKRMIEMAWKAQGIRTQLEEGKKRYDFQALHGFRKYYKSRCELSGMKPAIIEMLMGHSIGISDSYFRPNENEMLDEFLKAVRHLSISEAETARQELVQQETKHQNDFEKVQQQMNQIQSQLSSLVSEGLLAKQKVYEATLPNQHRT